MKSRFKWLILGAALVAVGVGSAPILINYYDGNQVKLQIISKMLMVRLGLRKHETQDQAWLDQAALDEPVKIAIDTSIKPFYRMDDILGELAEHREFNTNWFRGAAVMDVNGDGLLDLFFPNMQRTISRGSTNNVLNDEKFPPRPNGLFIHQGNDEAGNPRYLSVQDLQKNANDQYVKEELLFEGKYVPRTSASQPSDGIGRVGWGAVSADFNGDGLMDIYVLNGHFGLPFQPADLGWKIYPAGTNLGREISSEPIVARAPSFLTAGLVVEDGLNIKVDFGGSEEYEGRNTLYLNRGDKDKDGIPEWEDVTDQVGIGGQWASTSAEVFDYDRDGDLDVYVTNFIDPDYTGFPVKDFAGNRNQLYKNMLVEEGKLRFEDVADIDLAGVHVGGTVESYSYYPDRAKDHGELNSDHIYGGTQVGETADHSWAAVFHDWNGDNWYDLVVANDQGNRLRVYENQQGKGFKYLEKFNDLQYEGCWMGMSVGDLDLNGEQEVLITNCGSQILSTRNTRLLIKDESEVAVSTQSNLAYAHGVNNLSNALLTYSKADGVIVSSDNVRVDYSSIIPPDQIFTENTAPEYAFNIEQRKFPESLAGLEFAFNAPMFDVENDGDLDLYFAGSLGRGGDNFGDMTGSPGRFLENVSEVGKFHFVDKTLEYQLLDIDLMDYQHNPPRRPSPGSGWDKRDYVYVNDVGAYQGFGIASSKSKSRDIYRLHEQAACVLSADLNRDGFQDLMVTHVGGYFSNSPDTRNLKINIAGKPLAVPPVNKLSKAPTGYEPGKTYLYINQNSNAGNSNWVRVNLVDETAANYFAVGSKIVVNGKYTHVARATTGGATCSTNDVLLVGLGSERVNKIEVIWSSGNAESQSYQIDDVANKDICISRRSGVISCDQMVGLVSR